MTKVKSSPLAPSAKGIDSFTLVELLTVMAIIAILAALTLYAASTVFQRAARSRAASEIAAMSTALEGYKADNGIYPPATVMGTNGDYVGNDGSSSGGLYQQSSQLLYQALSGQTNAEDQHLSSSKSYMTFKANQLGNATASAGTTGPGSTYVKDPWNYSYGYSTGKPSNPPAAADPTPYNGLGFFDLWSTGSLINGKQANTNAWVNNWGM